MNDIKSCVLNNVLLPDLWFPYFPHDILLFDNFLISSITLKFASFLMPFNSFLTEFCVCCHCQSFHFWWHSRSVDVLFIFLSPAVLIRWPAILSLSLSKMLPISTLIKCWKIWLVIVREDGAQLLSNPLLAVWSRQQNLFFACFSNHLLSIKICQLSLSSFLLPPICSILIFHFLFIQNIHSFSLMPLFLMDSVLDVLNWWCYLLLAYIVVVAAAFEGFYLLLLLLPMYFVVVVFKGCC